MPCISFVSLTQELRNKTGSYEYYIRPQLSPAIEAGAPAAGAAPSGTGGSRGRGINRVSALQFSRMVLVPSTTGGRAPPPPPPPPPMSARLVVPASTQAASTSAAMSNNVRPCAAPQPAPTSEMAPGSILLSMELFSLKWPTHAHFLIGMILLAEDRLWHNPQPGANENLQAYMDDNEHPEFCCPITMKIFNDPVQASDGKVYEREAIVTWLRDQGCSPLTRETMTSTMLPREDIRQAILDWRHRVGQAAIEAYEREEASRAMLRSPPRGQGPRTSTEQLQQTPDDVKKKTSRRRLDAPGASGGSAHTQSRAGTSSRAQDDDNDIHDLTDPANVFLQNPNASSNSHSPRGPAPILRGVSESSSGAGAAEPAFLTPENDSSDEDNIFAARTAAPAAPSKSKGTGIGCQLPGRRAVRSPNRPNYVEDRDEPNLSWTPDEWVQHTRAQLNGARPEDFHQRFPIRTTVAPSGVNHPEAGLGLFNFSGVDLTIPGVPIAVVSSGPLLQHRAFDTTVVELPNNGMRPQLFQRCERRPELYNGIDAGAMANHGTDTTTPPANAALVVVRLASRETLTVLVSTTAIQDGDEILWDYGPSFWTQGDTAPPRPSRPDLDPACKKRPPSGGGGGDGGDGDGGGAAGGGGSSTGGGTSRAPAPSLAKSTSRAQIKTSNRGVPVHGKQSAAEEGDEEYWKGAWEYACFSLKTREDAVFMQALTDTATHLEFVLRRKKTITLPNGGKKWIFMCCDDCTFKIVAQRIDSMSLWRPVAPVNASGTCLLHKGGQQKAHGTCPKPKVLLTLGWQMLVCVRVVGS